MFAFVFKNNHFMFAICFHVFNIYIYIVFKTYPAVVMLLNPIIIKNCISYTSTCFLQQYLSNFFFMCINFGDIFETVLQ